MSIHAYTPDPLHPLFEHLVDFLADWEPLCTALRLDNIDIDLRKPCQIYPKIYTTLPLKSLFDPTPLLNNVKKNADWENRYILIRIYLPAVKHLNIQKIFFINRIDLPKYCCSIAQVVVTSFSKLVYN